MLRTLKAFNARQRIAGLTELEIGIGLSTGNVIVGNIGSVKRMEYTVIGDAVNLASRLESANKFYGTRILLSDFTVASLKAPALLREIDLLRVKGKDRPVAVFEALGHRAGENYAQLASIIELHEAGISAYRLRQWDKAQTAFARLLEIDPTDGPAKIYRDRVRLYAKKPPPDDWDGVWTMAEK